MSNIYIQEPPTSGKVLLKTTVGDIDVELWAKETPKACRNFVQLCMEGYYDNTIFHRVVKGFIVQGGDPTGTGTGGESIYGAPFKDEFHSRLRFNRRGLLAMANAGKDDNGSQFFFTMGSAPELQNKHTIFGKVTGETVYNMLKLEEALVDHDERPMYPHKIIKTEILTNPFPDIEPRVVPKKQDDKDDAKKKEKKSGVKNFKLLSFGEEAEEDEEEVAAVNKKFSGKSKSTHDLLNDPKLSSTPAVEKEKKKRKASDGDTSEEESDLSGDEVMKGEKRANSSDDEGRADRIRKKLKGKGDEKIVPPKSTTDERQEGSSDDEDEFTLFKEEKKRKREQVQELKDQIKKLKRSMIEDKKKQKEADEKQKEPPKEETKDIEYKVEVDKYKEMMTQFPKKGTNRESFTLSLLTNFQKKLREAKEKAKNQDSAETSKDAANVDDDNDDSWMTHEFHFESEAPVLAKDASVKTDDWFEIYDPRNPINKRRREINKEKSKR